MHISHLLRKSEHTTTHILNRNISLTAVNNKIIITNNEISTVSPQENYNLITSFILHTSAISYRSGMRNILSCTTIATYTWHKISDQV